MRYKIINTKLMQAPCTQYKLTPKCKAYFWENHMYIEQHLLKFAYDAKNHMAMGSNPREKTGKNKKPWMAKIIYSI